MAEERVLVYIDYENLHYNLINNYFNVFQLSLFRKLKEYLKNQGYNIIDTVAYCNFDIKDMHNSHHQTKLHKIGVETRHTSNNGKNYADIQITADILEQIYTNNSIDGIILISNDKDMTPLIKAVKKANLFVHLITTKTEIDKIMLEFPDKHSYIENILDEIEVDEDLSIKDYLYDSLNKLIKNTFIDKGKEPLVGLDRYIERTSDFNKIFEYEVVRIYSLLETEGLIITHKYNVHSQDYIGIITDKYLGNLSNCDKQENYLRDIHLKVVYKKYNKIR